MNKLTELEKKYEELGAAHTALGQEIEKLKTEKVEERWPRYGDVMFSMYGTGKVTRDNYRASNWQISCVKMGNAFRTEKEAGHYRAWLKDPVTQARYKVQKFADEYNQGKPQEPHFYYTFKYMDGKIRVVQRSGEYPCVKFCNSSFLQPLIDAVGEDTVKLACGVR